jgi:acyl dehydratase
MRYFEDFAMGARERSTARTLTETHVIQFCMLTGDWYPLHADKEWAEKEGPFGRRIAHGFLVLSFASGLMPLAEMAIVAFYGMDKVRFVAPTFIDDTLHVETEVVGLDDKGAKGGVLTQHVQIVDQRGETKADYLTKVMLRKRA